MEMLKRKLRTLGFAFAVVMVIVGIMFVYEQVVSRRITNDTVIERNITSIVHYFPEAPSVEEKGIPWDSELPNLIFKDIEYLKKNTQFKWLKYSFYDYEFYIGIDEENEPFIQMSGYDCPYITNGKNFSFYSHGEKGLELYVYDIGFYGYVFTKDRYSKVYSTLNSTIPFSEKDSFAYARGEYTVCFPRDRDVVYAYKDGNIVSDEFYIGPTKQRFYSGMILTDTDELKMLYLIPKEDGTAEFRIEPIGKLSNCQWNNDVVEIDGSWDFYVEFPLFFTGGEMLVPIPKDWDTFLTLRKGINPENPNYEMELVPLGKNNFKKAEFECQYASFKGDSWVTHIMFDLNGREITYTYFVNGYDMRVKLPEGELPKKKVVTSGGEFWDFITTIRETYAQYYDYPEGT